MQATDQNPEARDVWLRSARCAEIIGVTPSTLARWRCQGEGPRFSKLGYRTVVYSLKDVREWIEARARSQAA